MFLLVFGVLSVLQVTDIKMQIKGGNSKRRSYLAMRSSAQMLRSSTSVLEHKHP
jgi:hypothetical protein